MNQDLESSNTPTGRSRPLHRSSDDELVEACIHGRDGAWDEFVDRFHRLVYAVPSRLGLKTDACEDVFQSVMTIAFRELPQLRDRSSLPKWLMTIAHRESYKWLRRAKPMLGGASPLQTAIEPEPVEEDLVRLERRQIVHEGLDQLGQRCRDLLTVLFLERSEPTYQEISARLGLPVGAIGPTRQRCLRKLMELVGDRLG